MGRNGASSPCTFSAARTILAFHSATNASAACCNEQPPQALVMRTGRLRTRSAEGVTIRVHPPSTCPSLSPSTTSPGRVRGTKIGPAAIPSPRWPRRSMVSITLPPLPSPESRPIAASSSASKAPRRSRKRLMRALFDDLPGIQHDDPVHLGDGRQPMGDGQHRLALHHPAQCRLGSRLPPRCPARSSPHPAPELAHPSEKPAPARSAAAARPKASRRARPGTPHSRLRPI